VNWSEMEGFRNVPSWQGICLESEREILVALKRNDEYALNIKGDPRLTGFQSLAKRGAGIKERS